MYQANSDLEPGGYLVRTGLQTDPQIDPCVPMISQCSTRYSRLRCASRFLEEEAAGLHTETTTTAFEQLPLLLTEAAMNIRRQWAANGPRCMELPQTPMGHAALMQPRLPARCSTLWTTWQSRLEAWTLRSAKL